jgi:hypothetical protein
MDYLFYASGAITIGWFLYTSTDRAVRNFRRFWRNQIASRALLENTVKRFFPNAAERQQEQHDRDQQHIDQLLMSARGARSQILDLTQWFADYTRTTQALDNLPGRTSRELVDEIATIERDISEALTRFQYNLKSAIAAYTRGANLLERFEAQQDVKQTAARNTTVEPSGTKQVVVESTGLETLSDSATYMVYYPGSNATSQMTGQQIKQQVARGTRINIDLFICGPAQSFQR